MPVFHEDVHDTISGIDRRRKYEWFGNFCQDVFPKMDKTPVEHKICFVFRHQVQPWHPSSTLVRNAAVSLLILSSV